MELAEIYAVALGSVFAVFLGWHLAAETSRLRHRGVALIRKHVLQTLLFTRQPGAADFSVGAALAVSLMIGGNIAACVVNTSSRSDFGQRTAFVSSINLIPLLFGGRTSFITNYGLGLSLQRHEALHRWLGRIFVIEATVHACVQLALQDWAFSVAHILLLCNVGLLLLISLLYVRRVLFEWFLKVHATLAITLVVLLWLHLPRGMNLPTICLAWGSALWLIQLFLYFTLLAYRNIGGRRISGCRVKYFGDKSSPIDAVQLDVELRRPWRVRHGQFVYITVPSIYPFFGQFQSHPYLITWSDTDPGKLATNLQLLVECKGGFSNRLRLCGQQKTRVIVDGPYGHGAELDCFDKILFVASGIGVAAHLLAIRHLLQAHQDQTARVRRVSLLWFLEKTDQEQLALPLLQTLVDLDMERRRIFTIHIYHPAHQHVSTTAPAVAQPDYDRPRLIRVDGPLDVKWFVNQEWAAEAGNMAVSVCGTPLFERHTRAALRACTHDIHLITSPYQIDETDISREASQRYAKFPVTATF